MKKIAKMLAIISLFVFILSGSALDSEKFYIPMIALVISGAYLFGYVKYNEKELVGDVYR